MFIRSYIIKENSADTPRFLPVVIVEIFIAFFFKPGIEVGITWVAGFFVHFVKVSGVFRKEIVGRHIGPAAKPLVPEFTGLLIIQFKITVVGVNGRYKGISGMNDERHAGYKKVWIINAQFFLKDIWQYAAHYGYIHPAFFNHIAFLDDTRAPMSESFPFPVFNFKSLRPIYSFQFITDMLLHIRYKLGKIFFLGF